MSVLEALVGKLVQAGATSALHCESPVGADALFVVVDPGLAAQYAQRIGSPLSVGFQDGDDNGHAWESERVETPTEAAIDLLGMNLDDLVYQVEREGEAAGTSGGNLYIDGFEVTVLLITDTVSALALGSITRNYGGDDSYAIFDRQMLEGVVRPTMTYTPGTLAPQN